MSPLAEKVWRAPMGRRCSCLTSSMARVFPRVLHANTRNFSKQSWRTSLPPSPHRVEPRCPYFGRCGGCVYQHIEYEHQLALKWRQVKETLRRIGGLKEPPMRPFIPSPIEYGYRNRITVHVRDGVIGFFRRESNKLLAIERCPIARDEVNAKLTELRASNPHDGHYTLRVIDGPRVFMQANDGVAAAMLDLVDRLLATAGGTLIDAYCGAGFFAKRLRARFERFLESIGTSARLPLPGKMRTKTKSTLLRMWRRSSAAGD